MAVVTVLAMMMWRTRSLSFCNVSWRRQGASGPAVGVISSVVGHLAAGEAGLAGKNP